MWVQGSISGELNLKLNRPRQLNNVEEPCQKTAKTKKKDRRLVIKDCSKFSKTGLTGPTGQIDRQRFDDDIK